MKKNIFKSGVALIFASLLLSSCSDFLDAKNKSAGGQTADDYFANNASSFLVTAYNSMKNIVFNPGIYCQGTDLYVNTRNKAIGEFNDYTLTAGNQDVETFYKNVYKTINYANGVLSYVAADSKDAYEARFIRAYGYYVLTQQFGAVPYITSYINNAGTNYPRTPLADIYKSLIKELTDLHTNSTLADQDHTGHASKQAVAALLAKVYLAAGWDLNTTLNDAIKGTYTVNDKAYFTEAAKWAETAINGIALTMSYADKWSPKNEGNIEEIFSIQYERAGYPGDSSTGGHSMQNDFGGNYDDCKTTGMKNVGSENAQSEKSMYLYEKGDLRYEATYMTTMYNATKNGSSADWGTQGYYAYYNVADLSNMPIAHRYFPYWVTEAEAEAEFAANPALYTQGDLAAPVTAHILSLPNIVLYTFNNDGTVAKKETKNYKSYNESSTFNGVCVKKFDDAESAQLQKSNDYRDIVILHVSEMYLVAAEAYLMAGNTVEALAKVNATRQRAGLAALPSFGAYTPEYTTSTGYTLTDLDVILDERARELYAEGYRWMDLRRTKQLIRYNVEFNQYISNASQMANAAGEYKWYRPIPANEFESNTGISYEDQNPGY